MNYIYMSYKKIPDGVIVRLDERTYPLNSPLHPNPFIWEICGKTIIIMGSVESKLHIRKAPNEYKLVIPMLADEQLTRGDKLMIIKEKDFKYIKKVVFEFNNYYSNNKLKMTDVWDNDFSLRR